MTSDRVHGQTDVYPGFCRDRQMPPATDRDDGSAAIAEESARHSPHALRIKVDNSIIAFQDELQGLIVHNLAEQDGDFIVQRKDRIIAYQLAVVVDDDLQRVNHIVRGFDLLDATPKQIYLQRLLGFATPRYMHVPIIVDEQGYKLSKQTRATAVDLTSPHRVIYELLVLLKQEPPVELQYAPVFEQLDWAVGHWNPALLTNVQAVSRKV